MKITNFSLFSELDMPKRRLKNNILRFGRITGAISSSCDSIQSIRQWQSPTASILFLLVWETLFRFLFLFRFSAVPLDIWNVLCVWTKVNCESNWISWWITIHTLRNFWSPPLYSAYAFILVLYIYLFDLIYIFFLGFLLRHMAWFVSRASRRCQSVEVDDKLPHFPVITNIS